MPTPEETRTATRAAVHSLLALVAYDQDPGQTTDLLETDAALMPAIAADDEVTRWYLDARWFVQVHLGFPFSEGLRRRPREQG